MKWAYMYKREMSIRRHICRRHNIGTTAHKFSTKTTEPALILPRKNFTYLPLSSQQLLLGTTHFPLLSIYEGLLLFLILSATTSLLF